MSQRRSETIKRTITLAIIIISFGISSGQALAETWPALTTPPPSIASEGARDAALIIGIEDYLLVPDVPGASQNAQDWYVFLTRGRGVLPERVTLLRDNEAALESLRLAAVEARERVEAGGTLWVIFIGHGAPAKDGQGGVLVGVDAQQTAVSLYARSLPQRELIESLSGGAQAQTILVLDACFSGRVDGGAPLIEGLQPLIPIAAPDETSGVTILSAGGGSEFAGPLPGARRPAFSYLLLGALRGWGDRDANGEVTAEEAVRYARDSLQAVVVDRGQTPALQGPGAGVALSRGGREAGPDLIAMVIERRPPPVERREPPIVVEDPAPVIPRGMVEVPMGAFLMGDDRDRAARPQRRVTLDAFFIDRTEVTVDAYRACVDAGGCSAPASQTGDCAWPAGTRPINCVDWSQARAFCQWAGKRLPTEAEWEKAARGTRGQSYPWGAQGSGCRFAIEDDAGGDGCGRDETWPVGSRPAGASPYGALDMIGNVWEWTDDRMGPVDASVTRNPRGARSGSKRVAKGGGFDDDPGEASTATREGYSPTRARDDLGFRCAWDARP